MFPFKEIDKGSYKLRLFSDKKTQADFNWHMDHNNRDVFVLYAGNGWGIQFDNSLPQKLATGDCVKIPANFYHRVIRGDDKLVIKIVEKND